MAPLRQKLIHVLASIVAIDLAVAGVVIDARSGSASAASSSALKAPVSSGGVVIPGAGVSGILGPAQFRHRRGASSTTVTTGAPIGSSEQASGLPPAQTPSSTTGAPATTATTPRPRSTGGPGSGGGGRTTNPSAGSGQGAPAGATSNPGGPADGGGGPVSDPGSSGGQTVTTTPSATTTPTSAPGSVQPTGTPPAKGPATVTLTDRTGDTVVGGTTTPMAQPQADIVKATADWNAKALVFAVQVAQPVNPGQDKNWASDSTYITWDLDTTGDGAPDFEIQYFFDPKTGLVADVSKYGDTSGASACGGEAGYTADGYTVAIDPAACFGGTPAAVTFKATTYYDPNPTDPNGNLASDTTPDGGMSGPVSKP